MASSIVGLDDLSKALIDAGNNLLTPPPLSSTEQLLPLLDEIESLLIHVEQDQPLSMQNALIPLRNALVSVDLLSHPDSDVRVSVASCLTEILRITAPEPPYTDDLMKEIFRLTIEAFEKLADASSLSYKKAESVLDNVSKVRLCLVMLDLGCDDLILLMFHKFLKIIRSYHSRVVFSSMEMIMITVIDETDELSTDLLNILLASVKKENQHVSPMSWSLAEKVLHRCASKLKPYIIKALKSNRISLDMYSPVVSFILQTVNTKENKVAETKLGKQVALRDLSEEKLDLRHSRKEILPNRSSKRPGRDGTRRINETDKVRNNGNNSNLLKQSVQQVRTESTELEITGKRGRKPNSLMNPEEGYEISWISKKEDSLKTSNKKLPKKGSGGESSLGRVAAKKTPLRKETSTKQSQFRMDESDHDFDSLSSPRLKKLASCFRDEELDLDNFEISEDERKIGKSSKKMKSQNGLEKCQRTGKKKPIVESKIVNSSGKRSAATLETCASQSSKSKSAKLLAEESEETSKSHPTRRRTQRKEMESDMDELGENLVGKKVNIWWPLDKTFYEGVIDSYSSRKKMHRVIYYDGESEELNLDKERWELIEDHRSTDEEKEIDLPEYIPLSDILQRQKAKKSKNAAVPMDSDGEKVERSKNAAEVESEGEEEDSEDEPKWRETEDMEEEDR